MALEENPVDETNDLMPVVNASLAGVPAAYLACGSVVVTALAAATAAVTALLVTWARRR